MDITNIPPINEDINRKMGQCFTELIRLNLELLAIGPDDIFLMDEERNVESIKSKGMAALINKMEDIARLLIEHGFREMPTRIN